MDLSMKSQMGDVSNVRHRIRQLRWFKTSFKHDARLVSERYGLTFAINDARLTEAFLNWTEAFSATRDYARLDRRDFGTFAAGLLLRELISAQPVTLISSDGAGETKARDNDTWAIAHAWPEGFLYTNYCLCILAAVLEQDGMVLTLPALADDVRTWFSYRENTLEDPARAIGFLDLFTGNEPNWFLPGSIGNRQAMKRALAARVIPDLPTVTPSSAELE